MNAPPLGRSLTLPTLSPALAGLLLLTAACGSTYGPSRAAVAQMQAAETDEYEVIATEPGEGTIARIELLAPPGARREGDPGDAPPYVWQGAPVVVRVIPSPGDRPPKFDVRWIDDDRGAQRTGPPAIETARALEIAAPRDLPAGTYRVLVETPAGDSATLRFAVGAPEQATIDPPAPAFPWPPPRPATRHALGGDRLGSPETLGAAADRLLAALDAAGYAEHSFFSIQPDPATPPEGFALVTRLEQIEPDGRPRPGAERWSVELPEREIFSLGDFVRALFSAPEGHYRVIVFTVTGQPVAPSGDEPTREQAGEWLGTGLARLPPGLGDLPWTRDHAVTALIYQFRQVGTGTEPLVNPPDAPPAREQLERTGILAGLGG